MKKPAVYPDTNVVSALWYDGTDLAARSRRLASKFEDAEMLDPLVERCRRVREELVQQYGGLEGLFHKLEAMDRQRARKQAEVREKRGRAAERPKEKRLTTAAAKSASDD